MDLQPLRRAIRVLGPMLRRRGMSPEVGKALRRALEQADKALMAGDAPARLAALGAAVAEVEGCAASIRQSTNPADREQLMGAEGGISPP
jgi:hypothetical protein